MLTGLVAGVMLSAGSAVAETMELVIDRQEGQLEIFFGTRADNFVSVFGLNPDALENEQGVVEFAPLREGTYEIGDDLIAGTDARIGGAPVPFESTSLMVHPLDDALLMRTPFEAVMATAVCLVDDPDAAMSLEELQGYVGFVAFVDNPYDPLTLVLPQTGRGDVTLAVRDFIDGEWVESYEMVVADGGTIAIPAASKTEFNVAWMLLLLGVFAAGSTVYLARRPVASA